MSGSGNIHVDEMWSAIQAQQPTFFGLAETAHWVSLYNLNNDGSFSQVGIIDENNNYTRCNHNNTPFIFAQVAFHQQYLPVACYLQYQLGVGSHTYFDTSYDSNNLSLVDWVNWNGTWQALNVYGAIPAGQTFVPEMSFEINETGLQFANPQIGTQIDVNNYIRIGDGTGTGNMQVWADSLDPASVYTGGGYQLSLPNPDSTLIVKD